VRKGAKIFIGILVVAMLVLLVGPTIGQILGLLPGGHP